MYVGPVFLVKVPVNIDWVLIVALRFSFRRLQSIQSRLWRCL